LLEDRHRTGEEDGTNFITAREPHMKQQAIHEHSARRGPAEATR
jgi:hypothetical protein